MARYALYAHPIGGRLRILQESPIELEEQLQEVLKENPDLIPASDLGLQPPLLVVGRESTLASGYADLVCIDRTGMLVIVEVKRGKEGDARRAIAQALDYGSDIWHKMREAARAGREAITTFEETVATPYFSGPRYPEKARPQTLREAASGRWEPTEESGESDWWHNFETNLESTLASGKYFYIVFAPSIPDNVRTTIEYLSATTNFSFGAVEVDHFADKDVDFEVYVPHAIAVPPPLPLTGRPTVHISGDQWLATLGSDEARNFFRQLITHLEGVQGVQLVHTEAGYFGITLIRAWGDGSIKLWLSDSYSGGTGRGLFAPRDVLRLGYAQGTLEAFKRALDPWINRLVSELGAQDMRATQSRYARWDVPDSRLDAGKVAEEIAEAVRIVMGVPESD